jgi:hypothetical protein
MEHHQLHNNFLFAKEANSLFQYLETEVPWTQIKYFQPERGYVIIPRMTWIAGFHQKELYTLSKNQPNEISDFLLPLKDLVASQLNQDFNILIFTKFRDQEDCDFSQKETTVLPNCITAKLSLGSTRPINVVNKKTKKTISYNFSHGDLFVMDQNYKSHFWTKTPKQNNFVGVSYTITFTNTYDEKQTQIIYNNNLGKIKKLKLIES